MVFTLDKAALKLLKQNVGLKKGERVVVVSDRQSCRIFDNICDAVPFFRCSLVKVKIPRSRQHSSPLPKFKKVFSDCSVIVAATDKSISHCPETRAARKKHKVRVISMVEVDERMFLKSMKAKQRKISRISDKLAKLLRRSSVVKITSPSGSDFAVKTERKCISVDNGDSTKKGAINNLPYGEVTMIPIEEVNGKIAIDFARDHIKPSDRAYVLVKKGKIVNNNKSAKGFVSYLKRIDGDKALRVVELGFGTNPDHKKLVFNVIHDEKIFGSVHVAFGGFGDKRKCKLHEDVVIMNPTVCFDKKVVIKDGRIL
jgi:leucyl aminopeptidase (aminopeptidase T)